MSEKQLLENKAVSNRFSLLNEESDDEETKTIINTNNKTIGSPVLDKLEEEVFKYFTVKKDSKNKYNKNVNQNLNNDEEFLIVSNNKKKPVIECEYKQFEENFFENKMANYFRVLAHHNDDKNWDFLSYHNITTLNKWGDVPKFFNTLNIASGESSYSDFDIFIMKRDISPLWEDIDNRNGCLCQIKIDSLEEAYNILKSFCYQMVNNTLLKFSQNTWNVVNGLSFSPRKLDHISINSACVIIKIWFKINIIHYGTIDKILSDDMYKLISKLSIKFKAIKPEY